MKSQTVPGPKGNRFFGRLVNESRRDPLNFMLKLAREYGDLCTFRVGRDRVYFVNSPEGVRDVLVNHYDNFLKGRGRGDDRRRSGRLRPFGRKLMGPPGFEPG